MSNRTMASSLAWMTSDDDGDQPIFSNPAHSAAYITQRNRIMREYEVSSDTADRALRHFDTDGVVDDIEIYDYRNGNEPVNYEQLRRVNNQRQAARDAQRDEALSIAEYAYNGFRNETAIVSSEPQTALQIARHQALISDAHKHFELRKRMDAAHDSGNKQEFFESLNEFQEAGSGLHDPEVHRQLVLARKQLYNVNPEVSQMEQLEANQQAETAACIRKLQDQVMNYWKMTTDMPSLRHGSSESDQFVSKQALEHLQLGFLLWIQLLNVRSTTTNEPVSEPTTSTVPIITEVIE